MDGFGNPLGLERSRNNRRAIQFTDMRLLMSKLFCSSVIDTFRVSLSDGVAGLHTSTASSLHLPSLVPTWNLGSTGVSLSALDKAGEFPSAQIPV